MIESTHQSHEKSTHITKAKRLVLRTLPGLASILGLLCALLATSKFAHVWALDPGTARDTVKIAHNTGGLGALVGGDSFGQSLVAVGDLDRDGVGDLVVGAPGDDTGGTMRGAAYLLFMGPDGTVTRSVKIGHELNGGPVLADGDQFGSSVACIGDIDGDGVQDLAIGAHQDDTGAANGDRGAVYVLLMNADGTVASNVKIAHELNGGPTLVDGDSFGGAVAGIGDLNRDGVPDLAVGAPGDDTGGLERGSIYVLTLDVNGRVAGLIKVAHELNGGPTLANADQFGDSLTQTGDLNGDGIQDLAVGAWGDDTGAVQAGAAYVLLMNANGTAANSIKIAHELNGGPPLESGDRFGSGLAEIGDQNRDGVPDIAAGASGANTVYVFFMNDDGTVNEHYQIAHELNGGPTLAEDDYFGYAVAGIGDLDDDGTPDVAVGAWGDDTGANTAGAVYVLFMNASEHISDGTVSSTIEIAHELNGGPTLSGDDAFGRSVAGIGDLNRDGVPDLLIGADRDDTGGTDRGSIYVSFLNADGTVSSTVQIANFTNGGPRLVNGDRFGFSATAIGDIDRDGISDLAIGEVGGVSQRGGLHVLRMNADGTVAGRTRLADNTGGMGPLADGDLFGSGVTGIGDLDRDGVPDLAAGAPGDDTRGNGRGVVYVMRLWETGVTPTVVEIAHEHNGGPTLQDDDAFGYSIGTIGDVNGDGVTDIVVGATGDDGGGSDRGAVYILFMNADGTATGAVRIADQVNGGPALSDGDRFGTAVSGIGDANHDGIPDIAVGAGFDHTGGTSRGAVYVLTLARDGTAADVTKIGHQLNGGPTLSDEDWLGQSVTALGDVNRDGIGDLVAGAPGDDTGSSAAGAAYVFLMTRHEKHPSLVLDKRVEPSLDVRYESQVTYTLTLSNEGDGDDRSVLLTDTLPSEVDFSRWLVQPRDAAVVDDRVTWSGTLTAGESITFTFVVSQVGEYGQTVSNTAFYSGQLQSGSAETTFLIEANLPPVAVDDPNEITDEDTPKLISPLINDSDPRGDALSIGTVGTPTHGIVTVVGSTQAIYTPTLNYAGTDVFTYTVTDGDLTDQAWITMTVHPVDDPPVLEDDTIVTTEDSPATGNISVNDPDDGDVFTFAVTSDPVYGSASIDPNGVWTYVPLNRTKDYTVVFGITVTDTAGLTGDAAVTVTVTADIDPPHAVDATETTDEDTPIGDILTVVDADTDDTFTYGMMTEPVWGIADIDESGRWTYTPTNRVHDYTVTFTLAVTDSGGLHDTAMMTVAVTADDDPPTVSEIVDQNVEEGHVLGPLSFVIGDIDTSVQALVLSVVSSDEGVISSGNIALGGTGANRTLTLTTTRGIVGTSWITITVDDGTTTASENFLVTVRERAIWHVYMPLVNRQYTTLPDLVVEQITVTEDNVKVVIRNQGFRRVMDEFWVDLYVGPDVPPMHVNQTWQLVGDEGLAWGVTSDAFADLVPGGAITLTIGDVYYVPQESNVSWPIADGTAIYAHVDSAAYGMQYGAVVEVHEARGEPYNNISTITTAIAVDPVETTHNWSRMPSATVDLPYRP